MTTLICTSELFTRIPSSFSSPNQPTQEHAREHEDVQILKGLRERIHKSDCTLVLSSRRMAAGTSRNFPVPATKTIFLKNFANAEWNLNTLRPDGASHGDGSSQGRLSVVNVSDSPDVHVRLPRKLLRRQPDSSTSQDNKQAGNPPTAHISAHAAHLTKQSQTCPTLLRLKASAMPRDRKTADAPMIALRPAPPPCRETVRKLLSSMKDCSSRISSYGNFTSSPRVGSSCRDPAVLSCE